MILLVNNHISDEDLLKADGLNFAAWEEFLEEHMRGATGTVMFYNWPARKILHERVGRVLIINLVDRSLQRGISRLTRAHDMFNNLNLRFRLVSHVVQISLYQQAISFNVADHPSAAQMASHIWDLLDEMTSAGIPFPRDHWAGLVLQNGLQAEPALQDKFNCQVEIDFQTSMAERPAMNFEEMIRLVDIICCQQSFPTTCSSPLAMQAEPELSALQNQTRAPEVPLCPDHPDNIPNTHDFMAMQAGLCWQCRSLDQLLRNCPLRSHPQANRGRFRGQTQQPAPGPMRSDAVFQLFYPIITLPGFSAVYPQTQSHQQQAHGVYYIATTYYISHISRHKLVFPQYLSKAIVSQRPKPSANKDTAGSDSTNESYARMVKIGDVAEGLANIHFDHVQVDAPDNAPIVDSGHHTWCFVL
ncbi:uncharacterized protein PGTG_15903 [Puccinia graminis f. sp. tritici CRL 75-36-700-3]|uniref:Uncharacterized protein n=1 Tax=Puccinia graminis f. sp. tritici (strain CRL 75-36-700-3 / race SCCL) TaxID=418459 RepID=E3L0F7_PUCGT|nr:uncharacterized protein PGTG_15903 [Puccinia graminis f. sp. tritici CRL 75-36-700-3]EFP90055.2 hypothetical protein PGTG_15903 [Puccinia graminis f. sp. tritici CRL 75-36-700-3]